MRTHRGGWLQLLLLIALGFVVGPSVMPTPEEQASPPLAGSTAKGRPLAFELHDGDFFARAEGGRILVAGASCTLRPASAGSPVTLRVADAAPDARVRGVEKLPGVVNYIRGQDRSKWRTHVSTYRKVGVDGIYPGIDLVYYGNGNVVEYDFIVSPGTDPSRITLAFDGARSVALDARGDLVLSTAEGDVRQARPIVYQESASGRQYVDGGYVRRSGSTFGFSVGAYDPGRPLVIDPVISFSTYFGGSLDEVGYHGVETDDEGNVYLVGFTASSDFPTLNAFQDSQGGTNNDILLIKFSPTGALLFSTYLGGDRGDSGWDLVFDPVGNICIAGATSSTDFPGADTSPIQPNWSNSNDAFIVKLSPEADDVLWATYYGANSFDRAEALAIDGTGALYITGPTASASLPGITADSAQATNAGPPYDAFVAKIDVNGTRVVYSTFLGGSGYELGRDVTVDSDGSAYAVGFTASADFPTTANGRQPAMNGETDGYLTKINPTGTAFVFSTFMGGSGGDSLYRVRLDAARNIFIAGSTDSTDFPGTAASPIQPSFAGVYDSTVAKLDPSGTEFFFATYLGGPENDSIQGLAIDGAGHVYVVGGTGSGTGFPWVDPILEPGPDNNAFLTKIDPAGTSILYSTPLHGSDIDVAWDVALGLPGHVHVQGSTRSADFPTVNPVQATHSGAYDLFLTTFVEDEPPAMALLRPDATPFADCGATLPWATGRNATFDVHATAALNGEIATLEAFRIVGGVKSPLPAGVSFAPDTAGNPATGRFSWTPQDLEEDTFVFSFEATDGFGLRSVCTLTLVTSFDRDGDGLRDLWELDGYVASNGEYVDLPALGANVAHKDVFVYVDYMRNGEYDHRPADLASIVGAFANAPIANPDGTGGITLHAFVSPAPIGVRLVDGAVQPFVLHLGTGTGTGSYRWARPAGHEGPEIFFDDIKRGEVNLGIAQHFPTELGAASRYALFAHQIADLRESGISRGAPSSDFIVSLGAFVDEDDPAPRAASSTLQAGTFMHELGHGLGLRHGGGDETNYKPNYLSVMNYSFQKGLRRGGSIAFDYSRQALPDLDETALDEPTALQGWPVEAAGLATTWFRGLGDAAEQRWTAPYVPGADAPVDWNMDETTTGSGLAASVNRDIARGVLRSFDDWASLDFGGGTVGAGVPPPLPDVTETGEMDVETAQLLRPAPVQGLAARAGRGAVRLSWNPGGLAGDVVYKLFRKQPGADAFTEIASITSTLHVDRGLASGATYVYTVTMIDGLGVESLAAPEVVVRVR